MHRYIMHRYIMHQSQNPVEEKIKLRSQYDYVNFKLFE